MELWAKIFNGFQLLTIFEKGSILDVRQSSVYASDAALKSFTKGADNDQPAPEFFNRGKGCK